MKTAILFLVSVALCAQTTVNGRRSFSGSVNPQTTTYQVLASDFNSPCGIIPVASGTFTITLVASGSQPPAGQCVTIINYGSGVITIARSGQNINGGTSSLTLAAGSATSPTSLTVASDGTNYVASAASSGTNGASPISLVQSTAVRGNTTTTLAYPTNVTSGHVLVVALGWFGGANTNPTISDTLTTTWTRVTGTTCTGGANNNSVLWTGTAGSSGADTVTVGIPGGGGFNGIYVTEWTGLTETTDGATCTFIANTANFNTQSITTATAGDVVFSFADGGTSGSASSCIGSVLATMYTTGNDSGVLCYSIQNTAGKIVNRSYNLSSNGAAIAMLALKHP